MMRYTILLLCLFVSLLSFDFCVYGNSTDVAKVGVDLFKYDAAGRRDTFVPLVTAIHAIPDRYSRHRSLPSQREGQAPASQSDPAPRVRHHHRRHVR